MILDILTIVAVIIGTPITMMGGYFLIGRILAPLYRRK